ncbi:DUF6882 domain-containing protein [Hymenobacter latericus]|uniref:DUF6882 domain-containing protein n=1 Tax=Hymenobacter sp. YIM 151858-1 TaxID=2987688 RepID=UPI002225DCC4|nr:DUF6882 domain-containing protein [Hymenobacter sp. YIM 151858-1]UYZ60386.1 hypothetical protein OIS50_06195 [Hymenobacter sp. YIM 151858-1]
MSKLEYSGFADQCLHDLQLLQEQFITDYDINSYENWFYDNVTGLLTFSTGEEEINFRFVLAGTYSRNTNTWQWAWDKESVFSKGEEEIEAIKDFGEQAAFDKLITGYFESSEEEAWQLSAIAVYLLNGIGIYRPVCEHLLSFLVVLDVVDNETAQEIKNKYVECGLHECRRRAFVCQHLNRDSKVGFEEAFETYENMELDLEDDLQAWCDECEKVREREGEWNDSSMAFANIRPVCEQCYFDMKEINLRRK